MIIFLMLIFQSKTTRPRPVYLWNVLDVQKWLRRHCSDYYQLYHEKFLYVSYILIFISKHDINTFYVNPELFRLENHIIFICKIANELLFMFLVTDLHFSFWFVQHDITGRALLRINENILLRLGIENEEHRIDIWREIMKLHLKTDILEIRDIERRNNLQFD